MKNITIGSIFYGKEICIYENRFYKFEVKSIDERKVVLSKTYIGFSRSLLDENYRRKNEFFYDNKNISIDIVSTLKQIENGRIIKKTGGSYKLYEHCNDKCHYINGVCIKTIFDTNYKVLS